MDRQGYQAVIGLEVHAQLLTQSKIFATDSTTFGHAPNTDISVITLAHPGTLPKLNRKVVEFAIRMGLACHCEISRHQIFDRKNYFYPDLPKGYQLTQDRTPICKGGYVEVSIRGQKKKIAIHKIHMEEDAGKSIHSEEGNFSQIDFNRAGVPLIEIVTPPVMSTAEEAGAFLGEVRKLVRYLEICDGNMEEGSLRCDANISVMPVGSTTLGSKVEVKNMNSIRNVQRAIEHEIDRQIGLLATGQKITSETRTFQASDGKTYGMRQKEELNDYRYFPDPDLAPLEVSENWLNEIKANMPSLPSELFNKLISRYQIPPYDAGVITDSKELVNYFEAVCLHHNNYKSVSNWVMGPVKSYLNESGKEVVDFPIAPEALASLLSLIENGKISQTVAAQKIFPAMVLNPQKAAFEWAQELNLIQDSSVDSLWPVVEQVIKELPLKVEEFRNGKKGIISMFMGEVMKRTNGKADPKLATELIAKKLKEL